MKKIYTCTLLFFLSIPAGVYAVPFDGPGREIAAPPMPGIVAPFTVPPPAAEMIVIQGLTYWLFNNTYYREIGNRYVVVEAPVTRAHNKAMSVMDFNGKRYYVRAGRYYQRNIDGEYIEVSPPEGIH
ncbi:DUF6515 family protein [Rahnella sp. PCH160]|uniref:DUF6515 family protein n=1 Tax=Rahnella sp. PCH160 TaxID=3447928 RepID=UPI0039FBF282